MKAPKENLFDRLVNTHSWYGSGANAGIEILRANTAKDLLHRQHRAVLREINKLIRRYSVKPQNPDAITALKVIRFFLTRRVR